MLVGHVLLFSSLGGSPPPFFPLPAHHSYYCTVSFSVNVLLLWYKKTLASNILNLPIRVIYHLIC
jgi:hypothetical protein